MKSLFDPRKELPWFVRMTNPLRVLGWTVGCVVMVACLYPRQPSLLTWGWVVGWALCWPTLAFLHTRRARDARSSGFRNFVIDGAGFGVYTTLVSFSLIPATTLLFFQIFNSVGVGGFALAARSLLAYAVGILLAGLVAGFSFISDVTPLAAWVCVLCILAYTIPGVALVYRGNRRIIQLRNYLPRRVASLVMSRGNDDLLRPRRARVTVCAFDLRGFTAFSDTAEPEEVMEMLRDYYTLVGTAIEDSGGTVERFAGDGMVAFFNAPTELPHPEECAVRTSLRIQSDFRRVHETWARRGHKLGLGIGLACGYATVGAIGFQDQWQYAAIGTVTNLSARLCSMAADGEVLATSKVLEQIRGADAEARGHQDIRGLSKSIPVFNVKRMTEITPHDAQPALPADGPRAARSARR